MTTKNNSSDYVLCVPETATLKYTEPELIGTSDIRSNNETLTENLKEPYKISRPILSTKKYYLYFM